MGRLSRPWLASFLLLLPLWMPGRILLGSGADLVHVFQAGQEYSAGWWRQGVVPLWNPFCLGGIPWLASFRNDFYPPRLLLLLCPDANLALRLEIWFHLGLGWATMAWALRKLGRSPWSAGLAGMIYSYGGFRLAQMDAGHLDVLAVTSWAPLLLPCLQKRHNPYAALVLAVMLGCGFHHFQLIYVTLWSLLLYSLLRRRPTWSWLSMLVLAPSMSAWLLLPTWHYWTLSTRAQVSQEFAHSYGVPAWNLLTALFPHLFQNTEGPGNWTSWVVWEGHVYLSVLGLFCLLLAPFTFRFRRWGPAYAVFAAAAALGLSETCLELYLKADPVAGSFRAPGRFLFAISLLAPEWIARVLDRMRQDRLLQQRLQRLCIATACLIWLSWGSLAGPGHRAWLEGARGWMPPDRYARMKSQDNAGPWNRMRFALLRSLGTAGLLCLALAYGARRHRIMTAVVAFDVLLTTAGFLATASPDVLSEVPVQPGWQRAALGARWLNRGWSRGVFQADASVAMLDRAQSRAWLQAVGTPGDFAAVYPALPHPFFDRVGVRYWVLPKTGAIEESAAAWPRALVTDRVRVAGNPEEALAMAVGGGLGFPEVAVTEPLDLKGGGLVTIDKIEPNRAVLHAQAEQRALLVMTDSPLEGWTAHVDGQSHPLIPVNGGLHRGVVLEAGSHVVEFRYWPPGLSAGLKIALAAWLLWLFYAYRLRGRG